MKTNKTILYIAFQLIFINPLFGQITGEVYEISNNNDTLPLIGANVYYQNTTIGTITDIEGNFNLSEIHHNDSIVISYIGYKNDTIDITTNSKNLKIRLIAGTSLDEVVISERVRGTYISSIKPIKRGNTIIYGWVPNRYEYLKACDLVVSRAGHGTLTHSMCYGKTMVLIPTPNHTEQLSNAYRVKEMGIAEILQQKDVTRDTVVKVIKRMLSEENYRKCMDEIQKTISRIDGLNTATETILRIAKYS